MIEEELTESENIEETVVINSKMIDSQPSNMYITSQRIFFGSHEIQRSEIVDISLIEDKRRDYKSIGVIMTNFTMGIILAYTISASIMISLLIIGIVTLIGYGLVRMLRNNPFGYVSLETQEAEYRFGISDPVGAARLFGKVYENLDEEFTHEAFQVGKVNENRVKTESVEYE